MDDIVGSSSRQMLASASSSGPRDRNTSTLEDIFDDAGTPTVEIRVRELEIVVGRLTKQLDVIRNEQHDHCEHLSGMYHDLETYIDKRSAVDSALCASSRADRNSRFALHEAATRVVRCPPSTPPPAPPTPPPPPPAPVPVISAPPPPPPGVPVEVKEALAYLRTELASHSRRTDERLTALEEAIRDVRELAKECRGMVAENRGEALRRVEEQAANFDLQLTQQLQTLKTEITAEMAENRKEHLKGFDRRLGKAEKEVYRTLDSRCVAVSRNVEALLDTRLGSHVEQSATTTSALKNTVDEASSQLVRLERALRDSQAGIADVEQRVKAEKAHRVEAVEALEAEVKSVRAVVREHELRWESLPSDPSAFLEGTFTEVKDWLLDLEKRAMSKGEMLELVNRFNTQFAEINRVLNEYERLH